MRQFLENQCEKLGCLTANDQLTVSSLLKNKSCISIVKEYCDKLGATLDITYKQSDAFVFQTNIFIDGQEKFSCNATSKRKSKENACKQFVDQLLKESDDNTSPLRNYKQNECNKQVIPSVKREEANETMPLKAVEWKYDALKNYRHDLMIFATNHKYHNPKYEFKKNEDEGIYYANCTLMTNKTIGDGISKKSAKNQAAFSMLHQICSTDHLKESSSNLLLNREPKKDTDDDDQNKLQSKQKQLNDSQQKQLNDSQQKQQKEQFNLKYNKQIHYKEQQEKENRLNPHLKQESQIYLKHFGNFNEGQQQEHQQQQQLQVHVFQRDKGDNYRSPLTQKKVKIEDYGQTQIQHSYNPVDKDKYILNEWIHLHLNKSLYQRGSSLERERLAQLLIQMNSQSTIGVNQCKFIKNRLTENYYLFNKFRPVFLCPVGSFSLEIMRADIPIADILLSAECQLQDPQTRQEIHQILSNIFPDYTIMDSKNYFTFQIDSIEARIYTETVEEGYSSLEAHHWFWINNIKNSICENEQLKSLFLAVRKLRKEHLQTLNVCILDALIFSVTKQFNIIDPAMNLLEILKILALNNEFDIADLQKLHSDMISENKECMENISKTCAQILANNNFEFLIQ